MSANKALAFEQLVLADRLVHEPARLAVLTALSACVSADFVFLQRLTGLQAGSLSQHLTKLERGRLITLAKGFNGRYPQTTAQITDVGRTAITEHWRRLDALRKESRPRRRTRPVVG